MARNSIHGLVWVYILFCVLSFATGLEWLEIVLPGGFPLGTLAMWALFVVLAWDWLRLAPRMTRRRQMAWLGLILALAWYPVSVFQAGNPALTFYGDSMPWVIWTATLFTWLFSLGVWTVLSALQNQHNSA